MVAAISSVVMTTSSRSVLPGMAMAPWTMPIRQVAASPSVAAVEVAERAVRRALRGEHPAVDDDVAGGQVDRRVVGIEHGHEVVVRAAAGERRQVVGPVDRRPIEHVVRARDDHRADLGLDQPLELGRDALHRAARLDVRVEEVAGDQEEVDLLGQGEVDGRLERRELALTLGAGLLAEIVVSRAQMDVCGMDQPQHPVVRLASLAVTVRTSQRGVCHTRSRSGSRT